MDDAWEEHFAKSDDQRERYNCQIQDMLTNAQLEQDYQEYMTLVWDAGYGYDSAAYEAYWKRALMYYQNQSCPKS